MRGAKLSVEKIREHYNLGDLDPSTPESVLEDIDRRRAGSGVLPEGQSYWYVNNDELAAEIFAVKPERLPYHVNRPVVFGGLTATRTLLVGQTDIPLGHITENYARDLFMRTEITYGKLISMFHWAHPCTPYVLMARVRFTPIRGEVLGAFVVTQKPETFLWDMISHNSIVLKDLSGIVVDVQPVLLGDVLDEISEE